MRDTHLSAERRLKMAVPRGPSVSLSEYLRGRILAAIHDGSAETGSRLPSMREVADSCGTTAYAAMRAYEALEADGIVEKRERSGVFIASLGETPPNPLPETAQWLREVITEGYLLRVKLTGLPELIQRWTGSIPLRFACIDSTLDYRLALCDDVHAQFGVDTVGTPDEVASSGEFSRQSGEVLEKAVRNSDVVVTTPFHAPALRSLCARVGVPMIVATLDPSCTVAVARYLERTKRLILICVDPAFGERMMLSMPATVRDKVKMVAAGDAAALAALDPRQPALITRVARQSISRDDLRLLLPQYPAFSRRFAERIAHTILQLNLQGLRSRPAAGSPSAR